MDDVAIVEPTTATCKLCAPNCKRCSGSYTNCISCKTGWVLYETIDASGALLNDYCVPGDGLSHWHPTKFAAVVAGNYNLGTYPKYLTAATVYTHNACL